MSKDDMPDAVAPDMEAAFIIGGCGCGCLFFTAVAYSVSPEITTAGIAVVGAAAAYKFIQSKRAQPEDSPNAQDGLCKRFFAKIRQN